MNCTQYPGLGESIFEEILPGGLTLAVVPKKGFTKKIAYFVTDFGSVHGNFTLNGEPFTAPDGTAHFLEHKLFDLPDRDVAGEFAAMGASVNAFTGYDMTAYYFTCTDRFPQCLHLLLKFVSTPYFTAESVEKERGIIGQEIGMNDDSPDTRVFENLAKAMYARHPIRVPILGTAGTLRQITPEVLYRCHEAFYAPGNMMLCVVGDVDPEQVKSIALEVLGSENRPVGIKIPPEPEQMTCPTPLVRCRMEVAMPTFQLGFKCEPSEQGELSMFREAVGDLAAEALFGESSPLYLRLYQQGLIDSSFGGGFETLDGCAMLTCGGDSQDPEAVRDAILEEARRLTRQAIPREQLLRMKRSALGRRIKELDSFDATCFRVCAYKLTKSDYFRFPQVYGRVEEADIQEFLGRVVTQARCALSIVEPEQ